MYSTRRGLRNCSLREKKLVQTFPIKFLMPVLCTTRTNSRATWLYACWHVSRRQGHKRRRWKPKRRCFMLFVAGPMGIWRHILRPTLGKKQAWSLSKEPVGMCDYFSCRKNLCSFKVFFLKKNNADWRQAPGFNQATAKSTLTLICLTAVTNHRTFHRPLCNAYCSSILSFLSTQCFLTKK